MHQPFVHTQAVSLPLPPAMIKNSSVTVKHSAISNPAGVATTSANPTNQTISGNLIFHTTYLTTRLLAANASLDYTVQLPEVGQSSTGSTALQVPSAMYPMVGVHNPESQTIPDDITILPVSGQSTR